MGVGNPNIVEDGRATQFREGNRAAAGHGPPKQYLIDKAIELLQQAGVEDEITRLWVEDAKHPHPLVRKDARRDLMDRINGKARESISLEVADVTEPDFGF